MQTLLRQTKPSNFRQYLNAETYDLLGAETAMNDSSTEIILFLVSKQQPTL